MPASFAEILDQVVTSVERPKAIPAGTYLCLVDGQPKFSQVGQNKTDVVDFTLKILQVQGDAPTPAEVEEFGGVAGKNLRARFFGTDQAKWRLDKFMFEDLGIDLSVPRRQAIAQTMGKQVFATVIHRPSEDGTQMYAEIRETARV